MSELQRVCNVAPPLAFLFTCDVVFVFELDKEEQVSIETQSRRSVKHRQFVSFSFLCFFFLTDKSGMQIISFCLFQRVILTNEQESNI